MFCSINASNECITSEVCVGKYSSIAAQSIMNYDTVKKRLYLHYIFPLIRTLTDSYYKVDVK